MSLFIRENVRELGTDGFDVDGDRAALAQLAF
jgi:hypothetical protein